MVMVRHHARRVEYDARFPQRESEAVREDSVRLHARPQTERALRAAASDEVGFAWDDATRVSHGRRESDARASRELRDSPSDREAPGWHGRFLGWHVPVAA
jgi:hypothetical protein